MTDEQNNMAMLIQAENNKHMHHSVMTRRFVEIMLMAGGWQLTADELVAKTKALTLIAESIDVAAISLEDWKS